MKTTYYPRNSRLASQRGQSFLVIIVFVCLFLMAMLGVATDYTQIWAHRQIAQVAADAACQAGAADLFVDAVDSAAPGTGGLASFSWIPSTAGTGAFNCSTNTNSPPCKYASLNGYSGSSVSVSFPSSLPGVSALPSSLSTPVPYIQVTVTDSVPMQFTQLVTNNPTASISATAGCGVAPVNEPIPLVILHHTASSALSVTGTSKITILGGAQRAVQVNSNSTSAVSVSSTTDTINLSQAGPNNNGADFAVFGGPTTKPAGIDTGNGKYLYPSIPIGDPFAATAVPSKPSAGTATPVPFQKNGCPDPNGCVELSAGDYTSCSVGNISTGANGCLVFPYSGGANSPKFSDPMYPDWQPSHAYTSGTWIIPQSHNAKSYVYEAQNSGSSASGGGPNPWNQTWLGTQSDGGVTWKNIGVVTNAPSTAIFDPGLYYIGGSNGLSIKQATVRVSTATGDGSNGVMFYFSNSQTVSVTANAGSSSACTAATAGSGTPNNCIVSYKIDGTASSSATGSVPNQKLQCPSGSAPPSQVPSSLDGNILMGPCSGTYASSDGNRGFLFFQRTAASPAWGGGGQFLSSGFLYFHSGNGSTCGTSTSCLTLQGGSSSQSFTLGDIVVDELSMGGNPQINMILNPTATFQVLKPTLLQ
jgi:Putative Flp pilus-assembly TadE/G-like